jgi:tRNA(adenine34) deaminase
MIDAPTPMDRALDEARAAAARGEVPVGAVIVERATGLVLAAAGNRTRELSDPTAHAEVLVIRAAAAARASERLGGCDLYVTLEPCAMCLGAMMHARLARVVFGATDPKTGVCGSVLNLALEKQLNHHTQVEGGVLAQECGDTLRQFFKERRSKDIKDD